MAATAAAACVASGGLQELPDDVLALLSAALSPRDVVALGTTCRKLRGACVADKLWLPHCERILTGVDLHSWRSAMSSFQCLWRFVRSVRSLLGLWVHQNPELGNLVYVTWGFVSVVGCRIIPQELGPLGLETGLLWAPVFEIIGNSDGSLAFFLHGRENEKEEFCYPGRFHLSDANPNVLLLEAEPLQRSSSPNQQGCPRSPNSPLFPPAAENSEDSGEELPKRPSKPSAKAGKGKKRTPAEVIPFHRLGFGDRRRLLEVLAPKIALQIPPLASSPLFPCNVKKMDFCKRDLLFLAERRARLMWMYNCGDVSTINSQDGPTRTYRKGVESEGLLKTLCTATASQDSSSGGTKPKPPRGASLLNGLKGSSDTSVPLGANVNRFDSIKRLGLARFVVSKMKQMIGKNNSDGFGKLGSSPSNSEAKRMQLQEFLKQSRSVGLRLHATSWSLSFYRAWPIMHNNQFALYKIPEQQPAEGRDYAGLWGGTFGWPPGWPSQDKAGNPLFFLKISYEETIEGRLLIATKILEGTQYVLHPNGSAMFIAKVDEPSSAVFPWDKDKDGQPVDILHVFQGEGISNGYGFRYPGSKPGDLFVDNAGSLAFVWRESRAVLTLTRLDLQSSLENGERVPALPPVANFAYLTKSYSNVFAGSAGQTNLAATPAAKSISGNIALNVVNA